MRTSTRIKFLICVGLPVIAAAITNIAIAQTTAPPTPSPTSTGLMYRPNHIALRVVNLEQSVEWWKSAFGAVEVRRSRIPNIDPNIEIVFMHIADGFHIKLVASLSLTSAIAKAAIPDNAWTVVGEDWQSSPFGFPRFR